MSEVVQVALISGLLSLCVVVANLYWTKRTGDAERASRAAERKEDRDEWYRRTMFEKRLATVQEASRRLSEMQTLIVKVNSRGATHEDSDDMTAAGEELNEVAAEAWTWYEGNALYLNDTSPWASAFTALSLSAMIHARGGSQDETDILESLKKAVAEIKGRADDLIRPGGTS